MANDTDTQIPRRRGRKPGPKAAITTATHETTKTGGTAQSARTTPTGRRGRKPGAKVQPSTPATAAAPAPARKTRTRRATTAPATPKPIRRRDRVARTIADSTALHVAAASVAAVAVGAAGLLGLRAVDRRRRREDPRARPLFEEAGRRIADGAEVLRSGTSHVAGALREAIANDDEEGRVDTMRVNERTAFGS